MYTSTDKTASNLKKKNKKSNIPDFFFIFTFSDKFPVQANELRDEFIK